MASNIYPTKDEVVYRKGVGLKYFSYFDNMFYIKQVREGVEILATKSHNECHYVIGGSWYEHHNIDFQVNPVRGRTLDKNNKIICNGDVNVLNIFSPYSKLVLKWRPRCILTLLVPIGDYIGYSMDVLEFNYNEDEINEYAK